MFGPKRTSARRTRHGDSSPTAGAVGLKPTPYLTRQTFGEPPTAWTWPFAAGESPSSVGAKRRGSAANWTALGTSSPATPGAVRLVDGQSRSPVPSVPAWAVSVSVLLPLLLKSSASTKVRGTVLGMQI